MSIDIKSTARRRWRHRERFACRPAMAQQQFVTTARAASRGLPAAGDLLNVNRRADHGTAVRPNPRAAGLQPQLIREGESIRVVQSDVQYNAVHGLDQFADVGPYDGLRSLFSLHPEPFTVVARPDAGVVNFEDLEGKRVNIGNPGSGQRNTMELLMDEYGWTTDSFTLAAELPSREQAQSLCDNRFDAFVFTVGHPSGSISEPVATCDAVLVNVTGDIVDRLVDENDYYFSATIPAGMYNNDEDVTTFGVGATVVSSVDTPDEVVYEVVKAVFENFEDFKALHPAFTVLEPEAMISSGNSAPLHPGAVRYYEEAGLM